MQYFFIILLFILLPFSSNAQSGVTGLWKTIDDETGKAKSVVSIYEKDGKIYGKIIKLFRAPGEDPDPVCTKCPEDDHRFNKKIIGWKLSVGFKRMEVNIPMV